MTLSIAQLMPVIEDALINFTGETDLDEGMIECVAGRVATALEMAAADGCWTDDVDEMIESSSTYVRTDLDEQGLAEYRDCIEAALDEYACA